MRQLLPFGAIVGQEKLKQALLLNAINPGLRGVLIKGEKGTAKSTAVRALADLLPDVDVVADCPFNCSPYEESNQCEMCQKRKKKGETLPVKTRKMKVIDLPLGATEDRVLGTIDMEKALHEGVKALEPGLLARVNQGILYIDEVNLLDDNVVDVLLDAAAMGENIVEREGISLTHPSRFILVGTMNPEEGELRPQLLDRFGLQVTVKALKTVKERIEVVQVIEEFQLYPVKVLSRYEGEHEQIRQRIKKAKFLLDDIEISGHHLERIAKVCIELDIDGHRGDILIVRTARTIAAYKGRTVVEHDDIKEAMELVLPHRLRRKPFESPPPLDEQLDELMENEGDMQNKQEDTGAQEQDDTGDENGENNEAMPHKSSLDQDQAGSGETKQGMTDANAPDILGPKDRKERLGGGRRAKTLANGRGRYIKARIPKEDSTDIAVDATLRASVSRNANFHIEPEDLREKVRERKKGTVIIFVVDLSGSMAAKKRMEAAKGAVFALLKESYEKRDRVGFVAFRGQRAEVLLEPTKSIEMAANHLKEMATGKKTPLSDGLLKGLELMERELKKDMDVLPVMVLVSDGRGNVPLKANPKEEALAIAEKLNEKGIHLVTIDTEEGLLRLGHNKEIAKASGGQYHSLSDMDLSTDNILGLLKPVMT